MTSRRPRQGPGSHGFVDESVRNGHLLCVAAVPAQDVDSGRSALLACRPSGSRRIHMAKEGRRQRLRAISAVLELGTASQVYVAPIISSQRAARDRCLAVLVPDVLQLGVRRLTIESCDQDHQDKQVVTRVLQGVEGGRAALESFIGPPPTTRCCGCPTSLRGPGVLAGRTSAACNQPSAKSDSSTTSEQREARPTHRPESCRAHFPPLLPRATTTLEQTLVTCHVQHSYFTFMRLTRGRMGDYRHRGSVCRRFS